MFEHIQASKPDAILGLMVAFREDTRQHKLDLGVGVYKNDAGKTPVMQAITAAEKRVLENQTTKAYIGPAGNPDFTTAMLDQVFGVDADKRMLRAVQSVGGSGALRVLADLLREARPEADVWVSDPTWPNHGPLLEAAGLTMHHYPYYDPATGMVDFEAMLDALKQAPAGDIIVLHGCCHNPTGADLSLAQWETLAHLFAERELFPFIDLAYQGFGEGLDEDAKGVRMLAARLPELVVAASCSKNLGLYRERVGAALLKANTEEEASRAQAKMSSVIRSNYSMPPDHGASVSALVLSEDELNTSWRNELDGMRTRMQELREAFAAALRQRSNSERFDYIASQKGMFSRLPLSKEQIDRLREEHAIYIVGDGRINVAGLPQERMEDLAEAILSVMD